MQRKSKFLVIPIIVAIFLSIISVGSVSTSLKGYKEYNETGKYLSKQSPVVGSIGGEWEVIGLARSDLNIDKSYFEKYQNNAVNTLVEKNGVLSTAKYTEYSRVILSLTSIGSDVTNVGGYNLLSYLSDFNKVKRQGINGPIWALIALDSNNYEIPTNENPSNQTTREKLIEYILSKELINGGWALIGNTPDPDITAMAITSLAKYYNSNEEVKKSVDRGITALTKMQNSSGEFSSFGTVNSESTSQVIVALCSLGINPDTDKRFIKNGKSLVDILLSYYVGNGFSHTKGSNYNQMATEQCFYGLVAYYRLCNNKNFLYNMTDVYEKPYDPTVTEATTTKPVTTKPTTTHKATTTNPTATHKATTTNPTKATKNTEVVYTTGSYNSTTENKTNPTYNNTNNYQPNNYSNSVNNGVNSDADNSDDSSNSSVSNDNEETLAETTSNTESTTVSNTTTSTTESTTVTNNSIKENKKSNVITMSKDYKNVFINLIMIFVVGVLIVVFGTLIMMIKKKSDK